MLLQVEERFCKETVIKLLVFLKLHLTKVDGALAVPVGSKHPVNAESGLLDLHRAKRVVLSFASGLPN
jgi:hypothetical protein